MTNNQFLFRFKSLDEKAFKILATQMNKSMNELLGEIVVQFILKETKKAS